MPIDRMGQLVTAAVAVALLALLFGSVAALSRYLFRANRVPNGLTSASRVLADAPIDVATSSVRGVASGLPVVFRLESRDSNGSATARTEVDVQAPLQDMTLEIRPETAGEQSLRAAGLVVDVSVGDPAFDEAFIVEAAPADLVRELLDPRTRALLLALRPVRVVQIPTGLRLQKDGFVEQQSIVEAMIGAAAGLAARIAEAREVLDRNAAQRSNVGTPYRDAIAASADEAAHDAAREEIARVVAVKAARAKHFRTWTFVAFALVLLAGAFAVLAVFAAST